MSIDIPPSLQWISYLAGSKWPQGDEDGLWRIGEHWKASASEMSDLIPDLNRVRNATMSVITGETAAIAEEEFAKLFDGDYSVEKLVEAMEALGETARAAGTQIEASKIEILVGLAIAAAEILYALAMAPWTFGGSLAWIPVIEAFTLAAIRMLFSQLMRALARRVVEALTKTTVARLLGQAATQSAQEIAEELIINLSIQKYQIDQGHKDKIDGDDVANAAKGAAAGGAAAGAFHGPAFGALGGKHGGSGIGNAAAGAGASYGAEVVAGTVGALAVGGNLDAGEIFAGGALGAVSGGIESSHGGKNSPADGAPVDPDAGKSRAFDSDGKGAEGKGPDGKGPDGKNAGAPDSFDVPPPYAKDDPSGSPPRYDQPATTNTPADSQSANGGGSTSTPPPADTAHPRDNSSTVHGGGEGQQRPGSQLSPDSQTGASSDPHTAEGSGRADQSASQQESSGAQAEQSGSQPNSSSQQTDERGVQSPPQGTSAEHTGDHTVSPQTAGQNGLNLGVSDSGEATVSSPGDAAVHLVGDPGDPTRSQHDSQPDHTMNPGPDQQHPGTSSTPPSTDATAALPDAQSTPPASPEHSTVDRGASTDNGLPSNSSPVTNAPSPQNDSHLPVTSLDGAAPHAGSASTDLGDSTSQVTSPATESVIGTPPPTATAATTPPGVSQPLATTPSVAATPSPATPPTTTSPSSASTASPSSSPVGAANQSGAVNPAASANQSSGSNQSIASNQTSTANPGSPAKASLAGPGTSVNSAPTAVSSVATNAASPAASRSTADDQTQAVVGMVGGPPRPQIPTSPKPASLRTSPPAQRDPSVEVGDDETWRHSPAATAPWFDPVDPTPVQQIDAHRDGVFVQTADTEVANVLTDSAPTRMPTPHTTLIRYDLRRIEVAPNKFVQEYTVKLSLSLGDDPTLGPDTLTIAQRKAEAGVDRLLNRGHRLPSGDEFRVRVEFTDIGAHAAVRVGDFDETTQTAWRSDASENVLAHEILHYLGVPDEGLDPRIALRRRTRNTGVHDGDGGMMASDLLGDDPRLRPRHLWMVERTANSQLSVPPRWLTSADNARSPSVPRHFDPEDQPRETSRAPKGEDTEGTEEVDGDEHVRDTDGGLHWGRYGAAGLLLRARGHDGTPMVLLQRRAQWSDQGGTWGLPGGARNSGETAVQAALRETQEETGLSADRFIVRSTHVTARAPGITWTYSTVVADVPYPMRTTANGEGALRWVPLADVEGLTLHPGLAASWGDVRSHLEDLPMLPGRPSPQIDPTIDPRDITGVYAVGNAEGAVYYRDDDGILYREDDRPPEVIFEQGFAIREDYRHNSKVTHFISTTRDPDLGYLRAKSSEGRVFRYTIDAPGGVDVNRTVGIGTSEYQSEISFPGGIRRENIVSAVEVFLPDGPDSEGAGPLRLRYGPVVTNSHFDPDLPNDTAPPLLLGPLGGRDDLGDLELESSEDPGSIHFRGDDEIDPWDQYLATMGLDSTSDVESPSDHVVQDGRLYVPFAQKAKTVDAAQTPRIDAFVDHVVAEAQRRHDAGQPGVTLHVQGGGNDGWISTGAGTVGRQRAQAVLAEVRPRIEAGLRERGLPPNLVAYANPTSRGKAVPDHLPGADKHVRRRVVVAHLEDQSAAVPIASRGGPVESRAPESNLRATDFDADSDDSDSDIEATNEVELVPVDAQSEAYRTVAPRLTDIVERDAPPPRGLSIDDRFLYGFQRTEEGSLSSRAVDNFARMATSDFQGRMLRVQRLAGVFVEGISDHTLSELIDANPHHLSAFPELRTYLAGADEAVEVDVRLTERGAAVEFHRSAGDPTAEPRQRLVMDALRLIERGGYDLPNTTLEVHLPRYHRAVHVRPVVDADGRPVDLDITATVIVARTEGYLAEFVPPNQLVVTSLATTPPPEGIARTGVADELQHRGLALVLHELMHQLHWQQNPALLADLQQTHLVDARRAAVGAVSRYALIAPSEFVAEAGLARLLGRSSGDPELDDQIDALYRAFGGPLPQRPGGPAASPQLSADELSALAEQVSGLTGLELSADAVRSAEAQLAPFDRWRALTDRARLIAEGFGLRTQLSPLTVNPVLPVSTPPSASPESTDLVFDDDEATTVRGWQRWATEGAQNPVNDFVYGEGGEPSQDSPQQQWETSSRDSLRDEEWDESSVDSSPVQETNALNPLQESKASEAELSAVQETKELTHASPPVQESNSLNPVRPLPVNGDGWCLLYAVVAGLNPQYWPAALRRSDFVDAASAHAAVLAQLEGSRGRGRVGADSPLGHAARQLHALVAHEVRTRPIESWGDDVLLPFRRSEERWTAMVSEVGSLSSDALRTRLGELGIVRVTPSDSLSPEILRTAYVPQRVAELISENYSPEQAEDIAQNEVAMEWTATGNQAFTDGALGVRRITEYLQQNNVVIPVDLITDANDLRTVLIDTMTHQSMTRLEHAGLMRELERWQPNTGAGWVTAFGETFPALVAHTLGVRLRNRNQEGLQDVGPSDSGRVLDVFYNGGNHYEAALPVEVDEDDVSHTKTDSAPQLTPSPTPPTPTVPTATPSVPTPVPPVPTVPMATPSVPTPVPPVPTVPMATPTVPPVPPVPTPTPPPPTPPPPRRTPASSDTDPDIAAHVREALARHDNARPGTDSESGGRPPRTRKGWVRAAGEATTAYQDFALHDDAELIAFLGTLTFPGTDVPLLQFLRDELSRLAGLMDRRPAADPEQTRGPLTPVFDVMRETVAPALRNAASSADVLMHDPVNDWPQVLKKAVVVAGMTILTAAPFVYASIVKERAYIGALVAGFSKVLPRDAGMLRYPHANMRLLFDYARDSTLPWQSEVPWAFTLLNPKVGEKDAFGWSMFTLAILWYLGLGYGPSALRWLTTSSPITGNRRAVLRGKAPLPSLAEGNDAAPMVREDLVEPARQIDLAVAVLREAVEQFQADDRGQAISENLRTQLRFVEDDVRWARQWLDGLQGIARKAWWSQRNPEWGGKLAFLVPHVATHGMASAGGYYSDPLSFASSVADGAYVLSRAIAVVLDPNRSVEDARQVLINLTSEGIPGIPVDLGVIITTIKGRKDAVWGDPRVYPVLMAVYGLLSMTYAAWVGEVMANGFAGMMSRLSAGVSWMFSMVWGAATTGGGGAERPIDLADLRPDTRAPEPQTTTGDPEPSTPTTPADQLAWDEAQWELVRVDPQFRQRLQAVHQWMSPSSDDLTEEGYRLEVHRDAPTARVALRALVLWQQSGEPAAREFVQSQKLLRLRGGAPKAQHAPSGEVNKTKNAGSVPKTAVTPKGSANTADVERRINVPGDGWCLLNSVTLSTPPEQWPPAWVPDSMTAAQAHSTALDQARSRNPSALAGGPLEHARSALHAQVRQFVLDRGGRGLPDRAVQLFRGNRGERTRLENWVAAAGVPELRERLSELGLDDDHRVESQEWLSPDELRERYVDERTRELARERTPRPSRREARRLAREEAGMQADGRHDIEPPVGQRSQFEYLRNRGRVPSIRDLRSIEDLRAAVLTASTRRLTDMEYARLLEAVESWGDWGWSSSFGDMFSTLVAHTLNVQVHDVVNGSRVGPEDAAVTVDVRYNGHNHYDGNLPAVERANLDGALDDHIRRAVDTALPARDIEEASRPDTSGGGVVSRLGRANPVPLAVALAKATTIYRDAAHRDDAAFVQILRQDLTDPETGEPVLASLMEDLDDLHTLVAAHPRRALSASEQTAYRMLHSVAGAIVGKAMGSVQGLLRDEGRLIRARNALVPSLLMAPPYIAPVLQSPQALNFVSLIAGTHMKAALTMAGLARHATYSARLMSETSFDLVLPLNVPGFVNLGPIMDRSLLTGENPRMSVSEWAALSGSLQGLVFFAAGFADYLPRLADSVLSLGIGAGLPMPETERIALAKGRLRLLSESDSSRAADAGAVESQPAYLTQEALTRRISSLRTRFTMIERAQHLFEERGAHVSESTERQISLIGKDILQLERLAAQLVDLPPAPGLGNVDFWPKFGYALATAAVRGGGIAASVLARNPLAMSTVVPASTYLIVRTVTEMLDPNVTAADAAKQFIHFTPPALVAILPGVVNALSGGETFRSIDNAYPWLLYTLGMSATYADRLGEGLAWLSSSTVGAGQRYLPRAFAAVTSWRNSSTPAGQIAPAETGSSDGAEQSPEALGAPGVPGGFTPDLLRPAPAVSSTDSAVESPAVEDESRRTPSKDVASKDVDDLDEEWGAAGVPGGFSLSSATDTPALDESPEAPTSLGTLNAHLASQGKPRRAPIAPSLARPSPLGPQPWSVLDSTPKKSDDAAVQKGPLRTAPTGDAPVVARRDRRVRFDLPSDDEDSGARPPVKETRTAPRPAPRRAPGSGDSFFAMPEDRGEHVLARDIPRFEPDREVDGSTRALSRQALRKRVSPTDTPFVGPDRLVDANLIRAPRGDTARSAATARLNARWWQALSDNERRAMITAYPEQVGNAEGLPPQVRDEANRQALADARAREGANPSRLPAFITRLDAVHSALRQAGHRSQASDGGRPMVLSFDPEAYSRDGRILVAVGGDPYRASSVSWIVPGMTTTMASLGDLLDDAMNLVDSARAEGAPDPVVIVWIGYDAPSGWRSVLVTSRALAEAGGEVLHADITAFNAGRDPNATAGEGFSNNHVFAHSYGSTTTSFAGRDGRLAGQVRTITLLGSPGAGPQRSAADFGIGANVFVASSSRDPVTALGRTPDPTATIGQGIDPALQEFGARRLASEFPRSMDEMSTVMTHTSYYRYLDAMGSRSQSLTNFGRIVAGHPAEVDGDDHRVTGRPLLWIRRTHEPAIEPSAGRRWWGLNWGAPATPRDANITGSESDSDNGALDLEAPIELQFREKAKTLDDREVRAVHARATQIAVQATQRYQADPAATRLVVYVDVGGNGRRWPFQGWPYNGRPTAVGERRAAEIHRVLEEEVHRQLQDGGVPTSQVTFRAESRGRGIPDTDGRPHDLGSDDTARRVVVIRIEEEAPVTDGEVHVDFAERSTELGSVQRDELVPFVDHIVNEAVRRSAANQGAVVVHADGGGNGGNVLHKADSVGVERARATLQFLQTAVRARLGERGIHPSMVRFAEPTSRGSALPGGAPASGNRLTDAPATRRVTVRLQELPATHHTVDSPPPPRPVDSRPPTLPPLPSFGDEESVLPPRPSFGDDDSPLPLPPTFGNGGSTLPTLPTLPPLPAFSDGESVPEEGRAPQPRASSSRARSSLSRNPVDGGDFLAVRSSTGPDESYLDFNSDSDPE